MTFCHYFHVVHAKCLHVYYKIYQNNTFCNEKSDVIFQGLYTETKMNITQINKAIRSYVKPFKKDRAWVIEQVEREKNYWVSLLSEMSQEEVYAYAQKINIQTGFSEIRKIDIVSVKKNIVSIKGYETNHAYYKRYPHLFGK